VVFSFHDDHQFIDVSRYESYSWSTWKWWFRYLAPWDGLHFSEFYLRPWPMYYLVFGALIVYCQSLYFVLYWHLGVPWIPLSIFGYCKE